MSGDLQMMDDIHGHVPREWRWEEDGRGWHLYDPEISGFEFRIFEHKEPIDFFDACSWGATYESRPRTTRSRFNGETFNLIDRFKTPEAVIDHLHSGCTGDERHWIGPDFDQWEWEQNGVFRRLDCYGRIWRVYRTAEGSKERWKIARQLDRREHYNPKEDDCRRSFRAAHLVLEHAELHINYHLFQSIRTHILDSGDPKDVDPVYGPAKIERMPRKECRGHEPGVGHTPGVTDWLDDPWPEMSRD